MNVSAFKLGTPRTIRKVLDVRQRPSKGTFHTTYSVIKVVDLAKDRNDRVSAGMIKGGYVSVVEIEALPARGVVLEPIARGTQGLGRRLPCARVDDRGQLLVLGAELRGLQSSI